MKFIDTNVFVYFVDRRDLRKQAIARSLIASAFGGSQYSITLQILNEFANVALSKLAMNEDEVRDYISYFCNLNVQPPKMD